MSLEPSEKISMYDGRYIPIKDIHVGEEVLCFNPDTMITSKNKVIGQFVQPIANNMATYRIKTWSNRTIVTTKDHKFITEEGWKTVSQIWDENTKLQKQSCLNKTIVATTKDNNIINNIINNITEEGWKRVLQIWEENKKQNVVRIGICTKNFNIDEVDLQTISQQDDDETAINIVDIIKVYNWYITHIDLVDPKGKTDLLFKTVEYMRFTHCIDNNQPNIYGYIIIDDRPEDEDITDEEGIKHLSNVRTLKLHYCNEYMSIDLIKSFNYWLNCVVVIKGDFMFVPVLNIAMEPQHTFVSCINVEKNHNNFITYSRFGTANTGY